MESSIESQNSERECVMNGRIFNSKGELCTSSTGTFAIFTVDSIKKMGFMSEKDVNEFQAIIDAHV